MKAYLVCLLAAVAALETQAAPAATPVPPPASRLAVIDQDKDGFVSRAEATGHPFLERYFSLVDSNNDGRLSAEELKKARPDGPMDRADTNKDGQVSRQEAADFRPLLDRFDVLDTNKDGQLSQSELRAGRRHGRHAHHRHGF